MAPEGCLFNSRGLCIGVWPHFSWFSRDVSPLSHRTLAHILHTPPQQNTPVPPQPSPPSLALSLLCDVDPLAGILYLFTLSAQKTCSICANTPFLVKPCLTNEGSVKHSFLLGMLSNAGISTIHYYHLFTGCYSPNLCALTIFFLRILLPANHINDHL